MKQDTVILQQLVADYLQQKDLTHDQFIERAGGGLSRFRLSYLLNGKANSVKSETLAAYARAMNRSYTDLAAQIGIIGSANDREDARTAEIIRDVQQVASALDTNTREIFLDKMEKVIAEGRAVLRRR